MGNLVREAFVGTGGKVYENGEIIGRIESISVKVTGNFEDIEACDSYEDDYAYVSCKAEGEMVYIMTDTSRNDDILEEYRTGNLRERTITTVLTNKSTGKTASYSIPNVVYTEVTPIDFSRKVVKVTTPFKCGIPKRITA